MLRSDHRPTLVVGTSLALVLGGVLASAPAHADEPFLPAPVPSNTAPVANPQSQTTSQDTRLSVVLSGYDVDGDTVTYAVNNGPEHGRLSGEGRLLTYQPDPGYSGLDAFTFVTNDGTTSSSPATVTISVLRAAPLPPLPPTALAQSVTTEEEETVPITLEGATGTHRALTYAVVTDPAHGQITGADRQLAYTPEDDFVGTDSFTFRVSDGLLTSATATVTITVVPRHHRVNLPPVALARVARTVQNIPVRVTLRGYDPEGHDISYAATQPNRGTLTGTGRVLTYTPDRNFTGTDTFTFRVSDGHRRSARATVTVVVLPRVYLPVAEAQTVTTASNHSVRILLSGYSADRGPLVHQIRNEPDHGTLTLESGNTVIYRPDRGFTGRDDFTFTVSRGGLRSFQATVSIRVVPCRVHHHH